MHSTQYAVYWTGVQRPATLVFISLRSLKDTGIVKTGILPERHAVSDRIELAWIPRDKMPSCRCRGGMLPLLCRKLGSHRRPPPPTAGPSCGYSPCLVLLMNLSQCLQAEGGHGPGRGRVLYVANEAALYTALTITTNTRVLAVCKQTE